MFRVLIADPIGDSGVDALKEAPDAVYDIKTGLTKAQLTSVIGSYDALIVRSATTVDAAVLTAAADLRVIGRAGVGVDNIDIDAATRAGIVVTNTPDANTIATAEQAMALMLAASRHIVQAHASLAAGLWQRDKFSGVELHNKTLGIVGFGRVGRDVAKRAAAFGMDIIANDPYISGSIGRELGVELVDFDELISEADYISLHVALSPDTEQLIDTEALSRMKVGVVIINAARGRLIDEEALAAALADGKVGAVGLDVFAEEPPQPGHPLIGLPNVVHTPHLGASTDEAQHNASIAIVDQVLAALRGDSFANAVNLPFGIDGNNEESRAYIDLAQGIGRLQFAMAPAPPRKVEIEVRGSAEDHVKAVAAGVLKGLLEGFVPNKVNLVNAPSLAAEHGIAVSEARSIATVGYPNLVSARMTWDDEERVIAGAVFAVDHPRIVQVAGYHLDARPEGIVLLLLNRDEPGVVGEVATILGSHNVNIAEWRMGRKEPGGNALSFVNLDTDPGTTVLQALRRIPAVLKAEIVHL